MMREVKKVEERIRRENESRERQVARRSDLFLAGEARFDKQARAVQLQPSFGLKLQPGSGLQLLSFL